MKISLLLVDDDRIICDSLKIILSLDKDLDVLGSCINGREAAEFCRNHKPDVVLMDIRMPLCDGVLGTKLVKERCPETKVLILTTFDDDEYIVAALKNGASGYLLKNTTPDRIIDAIKIVHAGNLLIDPDVAQKVTGLLKKEEVLDLVSLGLTQSEADIVKLIAEGLSNKEIADSMHFSEGTVKNKISDILLKLNLRDRTQIAIFYLKGK